MDTPTCAGCGHTIDGRFCGNCGLEQPAAVAGPPGPQTAPIYPVEPAAWAGTGGSSAGKGLVVGLAVAAAGALAAGAWFLTTNGKDDAPTRGAVVAGTATPAVPTPVTTGTSTSVATGGPSPVAPTSAPASATIPVRTVTAAPVPTRTVVVTPAAPQATVTMLSEAEFAAAERSDVEALAELRGLREESLTAFSPADRVVVQLASKIPGIRDRRQSTERGTHDFYATDILAEYEQLRSRFGNVVVLHPADLAIKGSNDMWISIYNGRTFPDKASARAWCADQFPSLSGKALENRCMARTLNDEAFANWSEWDL